MEASPPFQRCQFVYLRSRGDSIQGGQCEREAKYINGTYCEVHRRKAGVASVASRLNESCIQSNEDKFPRLAKQEEVQEWVDEARKMTSPEYNHRFSCVICGRLFL